MQFRDALLALLVALVWGANFLVAKIATQEIPPFFLLFLRTIFATLPFIFFIPKPKNLSWSMITGIGLSLNVGKMSFIFWSLYLGLSPGIAALTLQTQVLFTIILAKIFFNNRVSLQQAIGVSIAIAGMVMIGVEMQGQASFTGFLCILCAALCWSFTNILYTKAKDVETFPLIIWTGLIPPLPLFGLSLGFEGWDTILYSITHVTWVGLTALTFTVVAATWIGATCWALLFRKYPATMIAPYALLIPVVAIILSMIFLDDVYSNITLTASAIVFLGLIINQWPRKSGKSKKDAYVLKKAA